MKSRYFAPLFAGVIALTPAIAMAQETETDESLDFLFADDGAAEESAAPDITTPAPDGTVEVDADDATGEDTETAEVEDEQPSGPMLDEVIVTAQKRAENVQDVPLSVTALGGAALKENNIGDLTAISEFTPNLVIFASPTFNYITLRGVGTGFNRGLEQSVAIVIDEVYYGRSSYLSNGLMDLEAIEVLRGPQGTLFGKNSAAGALHLRTANPTQDPEYEIDGTYGTYDYWRVRGAFSGPVPGTSDKLMYRVSFQKEERDGFIKNTTLNRKEQNLDQMTVRAKMLWEPTSQMSLQLQGTYGETKQDGTGIQISVGTPRSIAAMQVFDPRFNANLNDDTALDFPSFVDRKYFEASGIFTYEFENGLELKSVTNYAGFREDVKFDADFSPIPFITLQNDEDYTQFSEEIRFTSPPGDFEYVAGAFFFMNEVDALYKVEALANVVELALITGAVEDQLVGPIQGAISGTPLAPLINPLLGVVGVGGRNSQTSAAGVTLGQLGAQMLMQRHALEGGATVEETATNPFVQEVESYALFFQANWHMSDNWTLVLGNRISYEVKELVQGGQTLRNERTGITGESPPSVGGSIIFPLIQSGSVQFTDARERKEFNVSPKVVLQYQGFDWGMLYANAASGYKGGGFNAQPLNPDEVEFDEETSVTFELGTKMDLLDGAGRFNVSAFYTFYNDFQSSAFNGTAFVPTNVGEARVAGVEWDGALAITEWLMTTFSGSYIYSEYKDFDNGPCQAFQAPNNDAGDACVLIGKHFGTTPSFTATAGVAWDKEVGNLPFRVVGNLTGSYATRQFVATDRDPAAERPEYFLARGAIGLRDVNEVWSVMVYGSNLTDLEQIIDGDDQPTFTGAHFATRTDPREVKLEVRVSF